MPYKKKGRWVTSATEKVEGREFCVVDGAEILTMTWRGTGVCCDGCRKVRDGEVVSRYGS
jgi:hypothetical protein